jgi:hypothetical protein
LSTIPNRDVDHYYRRVVRPLKQRLDDEYMSRATFATDLRLIFASIFRRWNDPQIDALLPAALLPAALLPAHVPEPEAVTV